MGGKRAVGPRRELKVDGELTRVCDHAQTVRSQLTRIRRAQDLLEAYDRPRNLNGIRPTAELAGAQRVLTDAKHKIRDAMTRIVSCRPSHKPLEYKEDAIEAEEIVCSSCLSPESDDGNDILLCDGFECNCAYHQECVFPAVTREELAADEDGDWFCPVCDTLTDLLDTINEYLETDWRCVDDLFPELRPAPDDEPPEAADAGDDEEDDRSYEDSDRDTEPSAAEDDDDDDVADDDVPDEEAAAGEVDDLLADARSHQQGEDGRGGGRDGAMGEHTPGQPSASAGLASGARRRPGPPQRRASQAAPMASRQEDSRSDTNPQGHGAAEASPDFGLGSTDSDDADSSEEGSEELAPPRRGPRRQRGARPNYALLAAELFGEEADDDLDPSQDADFVPTGRGSPDRASRQTDEDEDEDLPSAAAQPAYDEMELEGGGHDLGQVGETHPRRHERHRRKRRRSVDDGHRDS